MDNTECLPSEYGPARVQPHPILVICRQDHSSNIFTAHFLPKTARTLQGLGTRYVEAPCRTYACCSDFISLQANNQLQGTRDMTNNLDSHLDGHVVTRIELHCILRDAGEFSNSPDCVCTVRSPRREKE